MNFPLTWRGIAATVLLGASAPALSDVHIQTGWIAWVNTHALGRGWSAVTDLQLRSADDLDHVRNAVIRPSLGYALNDRVTASLGYMWNRTLDPAGPDSTEQRLWQQLAISQPLPRVALTHRLRLEQRFIERPSLPDVDAVRLRYQLRAQMPLNAPAPGTSFSRGAYVALQGEVMGHLSGEEPLNGKTFDQLRAYSAIGWRIDRRADIEFGYQLQYLNGRTVDTQNHIALFSATTRF